MAAPIVLEMEHYHSATGLAPPGPVSISHCHPPAPLCVSQAVSLKISSRLPGFPPGSVCETLAAQA